MANLLARLRADSDGASLRRDLAAWLQGAVNLDKMRVMARETPTHYVWPLYQAKAGFALVINEFKDAGSIGEGYSRTLHNHRYSFASLILAGGYTEQRSAVTFSETGSLATCVNGAVVELNESNVTTIEHFAFHRLIYINDRTVTLLLKAPAEKSESVSVDLWTQRVTTHIPVESRVAQLVDALS
jgi:hypothetical protein